MFLASTWQSSLFAPAQLLGYLGMALSLSYGAVTSDRLMRLLGVVTCLVWAAHYAALHALLPALLSVLIGVGVTTLALLPPHWQRWRVPVTGSFGLAYGAVAYLTWVDAWSVLPLAAALLSTYACGALSGAPARWGLLLSDCLWLVIGLQAGSIGGVMSSLLAMSLKGWTLLRLRRSHGTKC